MLPKNIDLEALLRTVFRDSPDQVYGGILRAVQDKLGDEAAAAAASDLEYLLEDLMPREPSQVAEPMNALMMSVLDGIGIDSLQNMVAQLTSALRVPNLEDFGQITTYLHTRKLVRQEFRDNAGFGRAYTFFRQVYAMYPRSMQVASNRRTAMEGDVEGNEKALEDFQLMVDYFRALDGDVSTYWTRRLADLWFHAYERPVFRVCLLLWFLGQEVRNPGNDLSPPTSSVGELFEQARNFTQGLALEFPFHPNLNKLRNAIHQRQTKVDSELGVALHDKRGNVIERLEFGQLLDASFDDIAFSVHADLALRFAGFTVLDERGYFDPAWSRLLDALAAEGIEEADLLVRTG